MLKIIKYLHTHTHTYKKTHFPTECTVLQVLAASHSESVLDNCGLRFYHFKVCMLRAPHSITLFAAFSQSWLPHTTNCSSSPTYQAANLSDPVLQILPLVTKRLITSEREDLLCIPSPLVPYLVTSGSCCEQCGKLHWVAPSVWSTTTT